MLATNASLADVRKFLMATAAKPPAAATPNMKKVSKFKLDDPDVVEALAKKYAHLAHPGPLYRKIAEAYGLIGRILASPLLMGGTTGSFRQRQMGDTSQMIARAMSRMTFEKKITDGAGGPTMFIKLPPLEAYLPGKAAVSSDPRQNETRAAALSIMKALFPNITSAYNSPVSAGEVQWQTEDRVLPVEALAAINVKDVPPLDIKSWEAGYRGMVSFSLKVAQAVSYTENERLTELDNLSLTIEPTVAIKFPEEYARWATGTVYDEDWAPAMFWQHASATANWWNSPDQKGKPPAPRSEHPISYKRMSDRLASTYVLNKRPMVNGEGITMTPEGELFWVPDAGDFEKHVGNMKALVDPEGNINFDGLKNQHVATDWITEKLYLTDELGRMKVVDLSGSRPLDDATIGHMLDGYANITMLGRLFQMCERVGVHANRRALGYISDKIGPVCWENFIDVPYFADEDDPRNASFYEIGRDFAEMYQKMVTNPEMSPYEQLEVRPYAAFFGVYGKNRQQYAKAVLEQRATNSAQPSDDDLTLNNLKGVDGVMPHQDKTFKTLRTSPTGAILDISAGGGKSLTYMFDITDLLSKGLIKRPMIVMPRNLIAQFSKELVRFSKGYLKPFAINARVWRTWMMRIKSNPTAARQIINSMAKNTVFLVDYGFLGLRAESIVVGNDEVKVYPHASMLAHMGFDYVCLDESQRAKKLSSNRTRAANVVASAAKYRRIGSGTILHNTARDLLGQMSIINPMALGAVGDAIKENDRISIDRLPLLRRNVETFARRIKVPRREWAHLLPTLHERVHTVKMTRNQTEFYNRIMEDLAAQIGNDPKVRKLMKKNDENADEKLAAIFKRYLAKVEIWLNAPDSGYNEKQYGHLFKAVPGVTREDLMSPKIAAIDRLIDQHLNGGTQDVDGKMEELPPDGNKIMIVGYNKAVSEHVFEHMHHKGMAIRYTAGDDTVLDAFKDPEGPKILVADETAMQEGHNMQMVSRIIRLQTLWTPGGQEQLLARMMRPDVPDKDGKIKFIRDRVWLDWIVIEPSMEIAKMARLLGKLIDNSVIQEIDSNPNLAKVVQANKGTFDRIKRIKMDLDFIREKNLQTVAMLQDQFAAYQIFKGWENGEFVNEKKRLKAEVEERIGRKIRPGELGALSMIKVESKADEEFNPGQRLFGQGYTPFIEGFSGYNPTGLNLEPITLPPPEEEDEEDAGEAEDDGDEEDNIVVEVGDVVATEFGLGYITNARKGASIVQVQVPGFRKEPVKLKRYNVLGPTTPEDKAALATLMRQAKQVNVLTMDEKTGALATKPAGIDETAIRNAMKTAGSLKPTAKKPEPKSLEKPQAVRPSKLPPAPAAPALKGKKPAMTTLDMRNTDTTQMIDAREFTVVLYNGVIALLADVKEEATDAKLTRLGFERIGRQVEFEVRNFKAWPKMVEALAEKFYIPRLHKRTLDDFTVLYTKHRENVAYLKPRAFAFHTAWVKDQKKKATEKNELRPFPVVSGESVHIYINAETCPAALKLKGFAVPPGVKRPTLLEAGLIKFVTTRREALDVLDKFEAKKGKVLNRKQIVAELKTIKG